MKKNDVSSRDEIFNSGSANRDEILSQDEIFVFFACNRNLFFVLKTVARWHEISTRLRNNNFIPGWNLPYNQPLKTLQVSYKLPKVYRYDDILWFFPPRRLKPRINFCSQICINMKQILTKKCPAGKASKNRSETLHEV